MKESQPKTIFLKDYAPPPYFIKRADLRFDLDEESTLVSSRLRIERNPRVAENTPLVLDGEELQLLSIRLDDQPLAPNAFDLTDHSLTIARVPESFELRIRTRIFPQKNTALTGLYKSSGNFCTQCEAQGFRNITYFIDRPDVLARFTTTIVADAKRYPVLLSNGNLWFKGRFDNGKHWVTWQDPFPKPSYLFALVAGDLACIEDAFTTVSGREVAIRFYTQAHNADQCDHAVASLKRAMRWDEEVYGREYDLNIYMVVAVDDFNMGAMENKGLNVFNSKYVLAKPQSATDTDFQGIEGVIGHEYFHNWSGNRVTCRDWFQLSLKEGFTVFRDQEFSADMGSRGVKRIGDVNVLRNHQFREDAGPMAHPVRPDSYVEINNFYTMTVYNKGAEVVRMLHHLTGPEGFRRGTDLYFDRHDGQAVTTDDFIKAMEDANTADFTQFKRWYTQAGTPCVEVAQQYDSTQGAYTLTLSQSCPPTPNQPVKEPFHIPVCFGLIDPEGRPVTLHPSDRGNVTGEGDSIVLHLRDEKQQWVFHDVAQQPVPSLLRGFSAPVKLKIDLTDAQRCFLMAHDSDPFNRWEAAQQLAVDIIIKTATALMNGQEPVIPDLFVEACADTLLKNQSDRAMAAEILTLPSESYLGEFVAEIDPQALHRARLHVRKHLAVELRDFFFNVYTENMKGGAYRVQPEDIGRRALKNLCLSYLMETEDGASIKLAKQQFDFASNMTDEMAALAALAHYENPHREAVLEAFDKKWRHDALVMDKWFTIQATSRLPGALATVHALRSHPAFSIKNPNKVRALIGSFAFHNHKHFHQADGAGYRFLADTVLELDAMNPQVAARMVNVFTLWRRYAQPYRGAMHAQLQRISREKLSNDVYEIVSKSLSEKTDNA